MNLKWLEAFGGPRTRRVSMHFAQPCQWKGGSFWNHQGKKVSPLFWSCMRFLCGWESTYLSQTCLILSTYSLSILSLLTATPPLGAVNSMGNSSRLHPECDKTWWVSRKRHPSDSKDVGSCVPSTFCTDHFSWVGGWVGVEGWYWLILSLL